jgi:hypothetical protein
LISGVVQLVQDAVLSDDDESEHFGGHSLRLAVGIVSTLIMDALQLALQTEWQTSGILQRGSASSRVS